MMSRQNAPVVFGLFRREICYEDAVGACRCSGGSEFFEPHLQNGIVVAENNDGNLRRFADAVNQIENSGKRGAGFHARSAPR